MRGKWALGAAAVIACGGQAWAQQGGVPVRYEVSFDNAAHHEARIVATYRDVGTGPLRVQMSRSSPGRYAIHEFAKNVYSVSAVDGAGRPLALTRNDPYGWTIAGHDGTVTVTYTLFADRADGTYSQIDATHAHLNMPATFLWAPALEQRPIEVRFKPFDSKWKVATQLPAGNEPNVFTAPNLQYFMDSPTEISDHVIREWTVDDAGTNRTIRIVLHHAGSDADSDCFADMAKKVVAEQIKVFGDVPDFDHGSYTFLADYLPHVSGDGMEHRNSTIVSGTQSLQEAGFRQIGTVSHEFFHAWNVERLRPAELEPFDFTRANPTPSLWMAEGFTNYYGPLTIRRAGLSSVDEYLANLSGALEYVVNGPGRRYGSPQEMSIRAPFVDAATSIDPTNDNIFTSYYLYGQVIALALDLELRERFEGLTLDHYMRHLWKTHGAPEKPYTTADLRDRLAELTRDRAFADRFFASTVDGNALPDFAPMLARAGLVLRRGDPAKSYVGPASVTATGGEVRLADRAVPQTPLYAAGIDQGDHIVSLGGTPIASEADWQAALARYKPGETAEIVFVQRGIERRAPLAFAADRTISVVRGEAAGALPTRAQRRLRAAWLGNDGSQ